MKRVVRVLIFLLLGMALVGCGKHEYRQGVKQLEKGKYEEAVSHFEKAVEKEANVGDSYRGIGIARWELEDFEGSGDAFLKALENGSEETGTIYNFLGACMMKLDRPSEAASYYEQGILQEGCSEEMLREMRFNMIAAYEAQGDYESAKAKLAEYVAAWPDDAQAVKEAEFLETR